MIATDKFVYVHLPKTGGTFVTHVLFQLGDLVDAREVKVRSWRTWFRRMPDKHATCRQIPRRYRELGILSTIRSPYRRYASEYEFGWWRREQWLKYYEAVPGFRERFSVYPELSFEGFLRLRNAAFTRGGRAGLDGDAPGLLSEQFVDFYAASPGAALRALEPGGDEVPVDEIRSRLYSVHFLRTRRLNRDLHAYLEGLGYPRDELEFILDLAPIRPPRPPEAEDGHRRPWREYYTPELKAWVRRKERLLFELFPEFDT